MSGEPSNGTDDSSDPRNCQLCPKPGSIFSSLGARERHVNQQHANTTGDPSTFDAIFSRCFPTQRFPCALCQKSITIADKYGDRSHTASNGAKQPRLAIAEGRITGLLQIALHPLRNIQYGPREAYFAFLINV